MSDQIRISDTGELETVPTTWDGEPLYSPSTVAEGLFDPDAFKQIEGQTSMGTDEPDEWVWRPRASDALCDALDELVAEREIQGWRLASDLETRSLWRVAIRLPGCEQMMTEEQGWELVRNAREFRP